MRAAKATPPAPASERLARTAELDRHGASYAYLHRLAAAEDLLRCKVHGLLGVGSESSASILRILRDQLPATRPDETSLHAAFLGVLVRHDESLLREQREAWERRDALLATRGLLHELAVRVHRDTPQFTLAKTGDRTEVCIAGIA